VVMLDCRWVGAGLVVVRVEGVLGRQAGVIARGQALALGVSSSAIAGWVAAGVWRPLHPGVYLGRGYRWTAEATVWAAVLWAGQGATASKAWRCSVLPPCRVYKDRNLRCRNRTSTWSR
jgi:hypothetical protein